MQKLLLSPHVYVCVANSGAILLDLKLDRYIGLGTKECRVICPLVQGWPDISCPKEQRTPQEDADSACEVTARDSADQGNGEPLVESLIEQKLLTRSPVNGKSASPVDMTRAARTATHERASSVTTRDVLNFATAVATSWFVRRFLSLEYAVKRVEARADSMREGAASSGTSEIVRAAALANVFADLRPFLFTAKENCLFDSFALMEFLAKYGICPTWVIGVQSKPFGAHSWVQCQDVVLNDTPGSVLHFTPILAV